MRTAKPPPVRRWGTTSPFGSTPVLYCQHTQRTGVSLFTGGPADPSVWIGPMPEPSAGMWATDPYLEVMYSLQVYTIEPISAGLTCLGHKTKVWHSFAKISRCHISCGSLRLKMFYYANVYVSHDVLSTKCIMVLEK